MGKPSMDFTPQERKLLYNGEVARDGCKYRVSFPRPKNDRLINHHYDFGKHPLKDLLHHFIFDDTEGISAGTLNGRCRYQKVLGEFLADAGVNDLNPETIRTYAEWLMGEGKKGGGPRFSETSVAHSLNSAAALYEFGLDTGWPEWNKRDLETIRDIIRKITRGRYKRSLQQSIDKALSLETYSDLAKAVALEFEQCKKILAARDAGERSSLYNHLPNSNSMKSLDPNPFVVFALQAAMRVGLRATELNSLTNMDVRVDEVNGNHEIYVHAPDKSDDFIPVDNTFLATLSVCQEWSKEAREAAGESGEKCFPDALLVYKPTSPCYGIPLMRFSTYFLNTSHLKYFYRKWFNNKIKGQDGIERPLLHADGDPTRPLWIDYRKIRNSFAVRFAEREASRVLMKRVMRHSSISTTEKYYLQLTRLDHAKKVHIALKAESQLLTMGLRNAVSAGISEETIKKAQEKGAVTPHGYCQVALEDGVCDRANDCLECPHLVVIVSRKSRLEADRNAYLELAERFNSQGDVRASENALSRAKLCQAQIARVEEFASGKEK